MVAKGYGVNRRCFKAFWGVDELCYELERSDEVHADVKLNVVV